MFTEKKELATRGPVSQEPPRAAPKGLLVGRKVCQFDDSPQYAGYDEVSIYPAFRGGERCWLVRRAWCPDVGYIAEGINEEIVSLEEGIELVVKSGCIEHLFEI